MTGRDDRFSRADAILDRALDLNAAERGAYLDEACAEDPELRALVDRLLSEAEATDPLFGAAVMRGPLWEQAAHELRGDEPGLVGRQVGRYRVVRELGRGGMAVVYLAERADGQFEQQVALKVIKRGFETEDVVRRFARERQIMAVARHPDIARLLDGGATADGRPYLVMELVEGRPIDRYCDEQRLDVDRRLQLFVRVARAVGYAHRNLVVHRDIKPSNILVSADGDVKLLDFGIAKLLDPASDGAHTRTEGRFMTPAWASPEQVRGAPVTTASDIYQLGLLLYHLLTGRAPYGGDDSTPDELRRAIVEETPTRPSLAVWPIRRRVEAGVPASLEETSRHRSTSPRALHRELLGDLDNIVLMALRKEPERRYESVGQLIDDIQRYVEGRPVSARPDTVAYRVSKLIARHRVAAASVFTVLGLLVAFAVTMTFQAGRIARERDRANREAETARQVSQFLSGLFRVSDPSESLGAEITAREILERGARRIETDLAEQPEVRADLQRIIGNVYTHLGEYGDAEPLLESAVATLRDHLGVDHETTLEGMMDLAATYERSGRFEDAEPLLDRVLAIRRERLGPDHVETMEPAVMLAGLYRRQGRVEEAAETMQPVVERYREMLGPEHKETLHAMAQLANTYGALGRFADAEPLQRAVLEARRRKLGDDHPSTQMAINDLGILYARQGRYAEAEPLFREKVAIARRVLGPDHPGLAGGLTNLGTLLSILGRHEEALEVVEEALAIHRSTLGIDHRDTLTTIGSLASLYSDVGRHDRAEALYREMLETIRDNGGERHPLFVTTLTNYATLLAETGRRDEARPMLERALAVQREALGDRHPVTLKVMARLGRFLTEAERPEEAEPLLLHAFEWRVEVLGEGHPDTLRSLRALVEYYTKLGRDAEAASYRERLAALDPLGSSG